VVAAGYEYDELTSLSKYAARPFDSSGECHFPEVIFSTTANLSGEQRTPVNGVPYVLSSEWVGGPDIGYVRTKQLEAAVKKSRINHDLTVEAAVAISGAAFASAMGNNGRWYQTLLAVTGLRLGSWLPNPSYVHRLASMNAAEVWKLPKIPRRRRLPYLLREIFSVHDHTDRLLQVTDGGHHESLGLVELLRRRCTAIYCIDASGDAPPTTGTLEQSLSIARAELGVNFEVGGHIWDLVPASGAPIEPHDPLDGLDKRLSKVATLTIPFTYPAESGLGEGEACQGTLVFAKTLLTPMSPYDILSYAARNGVFPRDSTGDQFFDDGQFGAYCNLGRDIGLAAGIAGSRAHKSR
jgi:hypothetical protein